MPDFFNSVLRIELGSSCLWGKLTNLTNWALSPPCLPLQFYEQMFTNLKSCAALQMNVHQPPVDLVKDRLRQDGRGGVQNLECDKSLARPCRLLVWVPHLKQWGDGSLSRLSTPPSHLPTGVKRAQNCKQVSTCSRIPVSKESNVWKNNEKESQKERESFKLQQVPAIKGGSN